MNHKHTHRHLINDDDDDDLIFDSNRWKMFDYHQISSFYLCDL